MSGIDCAIQSVVDAKQAALHQQIGIAVAAKQLDATKASGDAAVALLDAAAQLSKAIGKGGAFDAQA